MFFSVIIIKIQALNLAIRITFKLSSKSRYYSTYEKNENDDHEKEGEDVGTPWADAAVAGL